MIQIDETKLAKLSTTNQMLDEKYGVHGTDTRNEFDEQSIAWFLPVIQLFRLVSRLAGEVDSQLS